MTKYTIAVNAGEYLSGLYDTKEEVQSAAFDLIMESGYDISKEQWQEDDYYKDKPCELYVLDIAHEMSWFNIKEIKL